MLSKLILPIENSFYFFPDQLGKKPSSDRVIANWPVAGQRFICKVDDFFDEGVAQEAAKNQQQMASVPNPTVEGCDIVRVPLIGDLIGDFVSPRLVSPIVHFDSHYKLINREQIKDCLSGNDSPESVVDLMFSSLEKLALMGNWSKAEVPITAFFLRYKLAQNNPSITNLPWHSDINSLSMTAVISPCKQDTGELSGGELLFAERTKDFTTYLYNSGRHKTVVSETEKQFAYPGNGCLIFENLWSFHKVSDIKMVAGSSCERILFSIFANPSPNQLNTFFERNKALNLV